MLTRFAIVMVLFALVVTGCHTRSTFTMVEGTRHSGVVVRSDAESVVLRGRFGGEHRVALQDVDSVAWAGTPATILGGSVVAAGVVTLGATVAFSVDIGDEEFTISGAVTGALFVVAGLVPLIWGVVTSAEARERALAPFLKASPPGATTNGPANKSDASDAPVRTTAVPGPSLQVAPWLSPSSSGSAGGIRLDGRF